MSIFASAICKIKKIHKKHLEKSNKRSKDYNTVIIIFNIFIVW